MTGHPLSLVTWIFNKHLKHSLRPQKCSYKKEVCILLRTFTKLPPLDYFDIPLGSLVLKLILALSQNNEFEAKDSK